MRPCTVAGHERLLGCLCHCGYCLSPTACWGEQAADARRLLPSTHRTFSWSTHGLFLGSHWPQESQEVSDHPTFSGSRPPQCRPTAPHGSGALAAVHLYFSCARASIAAWLFWQCPEVTTELSPVRGPSHREAPGGEGSGRESRLTSRRASAGVCTSRPRSQMGSREGGATHGHELGSPGGHQVPPGNTQGGPSGPLRLAEWVSLDRAEP